MPALIFHINCVKDCDFYIKRKCSYLSVNTVFHPAQFKLYVFSIFHAVTKCYNYSFCWSPLLLQRSKEKWTLVLTYFIITVVMCKRFARIFFWKTSNQGFKKWHHLPFPSEFNMVWDENEVSASFGRTWFDGSDY